MRRNLLYLALIMLCCGVFLLYVFGYQRAQDQQPPTISFAEEALALSTRDPRENLLQGVTAHDSKDGDVTDSLVVASIRLMDADGTIQVTYTAFDAAGNVTKAVRNAKYTDYESPRFSLKRSLTYQYNTAFDIFAAVQATDGLDGDISHRIRITTLDESSISTVGTHMVELKTSNSLGETVRLVVPVEVYAAGTYDGTLTLTDYLVYLPLGGKLDAESYLDTYTRAGAIIPLFDGIPEGCSLEVKSDVQPEIPGVYTVEYRLTQTVVGSTRAYTGYAKLIVVVEG